MATTSAPRRIRPIKDRSLRLEPGVFERLDDDAPLTLAEACELIFRNVITPGTLRLEAQKGRLVMEKVGQRYFVTKAGIRDMRRLCRVEPDRNVGQDAPQPRASGLSAQEELRIRLEIAKRTDKEAREKEKTENKARRAGEQAGQRRT